jgi:uncharacterized protein (TIGR02231 family)
MKHLFLFILAFNLLNAKAIGVPSKIKEVTIYLNGARVERSASTNLAPGTNEVVFDGLSNDIDQSSIEVQGQGNATILSVNYRINYLKQQEQSEEVHKVKNSLDSAKLKLEYVKNEIIVLEQENQLMQANYKLGINDKTEFIEDVDEWAVKYHKHVLEIRNLVTRLIIQSTDLTALVNNLQNELNQASATNKMPSGEIVVMVSTTAYNQADFRIAYYVRNASWSPVYNLRAQNTTDPVKLDYDALVTQNTGETWKDIKMVLSTANPTLGGTKPELMPFYLNFSEYLYKKSNRYSEMPAAAQPVYEKDEAKADMSTSANYTTVTQNQLNVTFNINLRYTILPDGTPQQVRIQQISLPATYEYAAVPKLDKDAFMLAKVTGWENDNILPGPASLYFEGAYVGKSYIDPSVTNDTLNLSFGRDKKINIDRKQLKDFSKKSFFGKTITQNFVFELSIKNTKNSPIIITLEDQVPISQNKEIEVIVKENSKAEYDTQTGKLQWKLNLQANEIRKLKLDYSVKFPKGKIVSGL